MDSPQSRIAEVRSSVLDELCRRGADEPAFHGLGGAEIAAQTKQLLSEFERYVLYRDLESYRAFVRRWIALRVGAGILHEDLIATLVSVGDAIIRALEDRGANDPEGHELLQAIAGANFDSARTVVQVLADEYARRRAQLKEFVAEEG